MNDERRTAIVAMSIYELIGVPLYKPFKFFYVPGRIDKVKRPRMYATLGVLAALLVAIVYLPLPHSVMCPVEIQARGAKSVYVDVAGGGRLAEVLVEPGQYVTKGTVLARLTSVDLDLEIMRLTGQLKQYDVGLESARQLHLQGNRLAGGEIPWIQEALDTVQKQLDERSLDRDRLTLKAPIDGTVLPPPPNNRKPPEEQLRSWIRTPLDKENLGAHLKARTLFCKIGNPKQLEAILLIDQVDRNLLNVGHDVEIKLDELPPDVFPGEITEIAKAKMEVESATGVERPQSASYEAKVPLLDDDHLLLIGLRGQAEVHTGWLPLGTRIRRFINHTFSFRI